MDITEENKCCFWEEEASFEATVYLFVEVKDKYNKVLHRKAGEDTVKM